MPAVPRRSAPLLVVLAALPLTAARDAAPPPGFEPSPVASPRLPISPASRTYYTRPITTWFEGHVGTSAYIQVDRPLYRPGDKVAFRAWELGTRTLTPTEGERAVRLLDPRGGVAGTVNGRTGALEVPKEAAGGEWKLQLVEGPRVVTSRSIIVRAVQIPKFKLTMDMPAEAVAPGASVTAPFRALRATGEPLAGARVVAIVQVDGRQSSAQDLVTDAKGEVRIAFAVPQNVGSGDVTLTALVTDGGVSESTSRAVPVSVTQLALAAFPEGGTLVTGVPSRVFFQVTDAHGAPAAAEGIVTDQGGARVADWKTELDGRGSVTLRPEPGRQYKLELTSAPRHVVTALSAPQPDGCVLRTYADVDGAVAPIRAEITCASPRAVVVVASQRESLLDMARVDVAPDEPAVVYLEPADPALKAAPGVARVTVFQGQVPLAERVVFRNRNAAFRVDIVPDRPDYEPGDTVNLQVRARTRSGAPVAADLALSVVDDNLLAYADDDAPGLVETALLSAEVPGPVPDIRHYFDPDDPSSAQAMDLLLATRGYRRFDWAAVWAVDAAAQTRKRNAELGVDTENAAPGQVLTEEFLARIPAGRDYQEAAPMAAGRVAGRDDDENDGPARRADRDARGAKPPAPTPARVVAAPPVATVRTDFRETVYWNADLHTDRAGNAKVSFPLTDAVGSFRVLAEGAGGGLVGAGEGLLTSHLPLALDVKLPDSMTRGDRPLLPVLVTNDSTEPMDVTLTADWAGLLAPHGAAPAPVHVEAGQRASAWLPLDVIATMGKGKVTITGRSGRHADAFARAIEVSPPGFPQTRSVGGTLTARADTSLELPTWMPGTLTAAVKVYPSAVATMVDGLEGMLREPSGCFEQTSSTNYPNVMILQYLRGQPSKDPAVSTRAAGLLDSGYRKLTGFEANSGGYEWFGGSPGHEALTAYGLLEFADMRAVFPSVDRAMIDRTAKWLIGTRRDGRGGYLRNERALDSFGRASQAVTDAYITWSLAEAGYASQIGPELDAAQRLARETRDPYILALTTAALAKGRPDAARGPLASLLSLQAADGSFPGAAESITKSGGSNLLVETTALAALAIMDAHGNEAGLRSAVDWLTTHRQGGGGWGATQATVLALRALTTYADTHRSTTAPGVIEVHVNGQAAGRLAYEAGQEGVLRIEGFEGLLRPGPNEITLFGSGASSMSYTVDVAYRTEAPLTDPTTAVDLVTTLDQGRVGMGKTVTLRATVTNLTPAGQPMTLARIGIPGGLSAQEWQLRKLSDDGDIDFYETRPGEVDLYWRSLAPGAVERVNLELNATVPGTWTGPASSAYLYYTDDHRDWEQPVTVEVTPPAG